MDLKNRCWAEISASAILHNIHQVKKRLGPGVKLLAVVKANAYGHGAVFVSRLLSREADYLGVACPAEAAELREAGIDKPVLILGHTYSTEWEEMIRLGVTMSVSSWQEAWEINRCAERMNRIAREAAPQGDFTYTARIHIALDTGMTRIGFDITEQSAAEIREISRMPYIMIEGMFSHLSCADQQDQTFSEDQMEQFEKMIDDHDFLEYARYVDNYYGTPKIPVFEQLARGRDVILEIDTEGAFQVKKEFSDAVLIFILPPSVTELFRRLEKRGTESKESLRQRTILAKREMTCSYRFDYVVLNDDLDKAVDDMLLLMNAVREGTPEAEHFSTDGDDANRLIEEVVTNA